MKRLIIFRSMTDGTELVLPVTPPEYELESAQAIEAVDMHAVGTINLPGLPKLLNKNIECMFPAHNYPFNNVGASTDPFYYVDKFKSFVEHHTILRFIVSDTSINEPIFIESISYGEKDGTNDIYATISIRGYREISAPTVEKVTDSTKNSERTESVTAIQSTYTVATGDTLWSIAYRFYGDGSLCYKLAAYNNIANANLIRVGQVIKLPALDELKAASPVKSAPTSNPTSAKTETTAVIKVVFAGDARYYGRLIVKGTDVNGKTVAKTFSESGSMAVKNKSAVSLRWYGEGGHKAILCTVNSVQIAAGNGSYVFAPDRIGTVQIRWGA